MRDLTPRNPFDTERRRGHHLVGGPLGRGPREERHFVIAGTIAAIVGALVTAYGAYSASQAQAAALTYEQKVNKQRAQASNDAAAAAAQSQSEESQHALAHLRSQAEASSIVTGEGSELLAEMQSKGNAALERKRLLYAGATQSAYFQQEAVIRGYEAKDVRRAGYISAGASLLGGAGRAYSASSGGGGLSGGTDFWGSGGSGGGYASYRAGERA